MDDIVEDDDDDSISIDDDGGDRFCLESSEPAPTNDVRDTIISSSNHIKHVKMKSPTSTVDPSP